MFLNRLLRLIAETGITKNKLLTDLGLSKNSFVDWDKRGTIPNGDTLQKIADYFDCTVDYLLGRTDDRHQKPGEENIKFDDFTYAMYQESADLSEEEKTMLLQMARMLKTRVKEKEMLNNITDNKE